MSQASTFDPPLSDRELWDCAVLVEKLHGDRGAHFISDRMTVLAEEGDLEGVTAWKAIADRFDQLQRRRPPPVI